MRFKAKATCFVNGHFLRQGEEAELPDTTPDTPGVLEALNRPAPCEPDPVPEDDDKAEGGELAGDPASPPEAKPKRKYTRRANATE